MTYFAKPGMAVAFGAFMLCAETCLHAEEILAASPLELPLYDWTAGGFLLGAGIVASREWTPTRRQYQAAAWAFMLSLLSGAFVNHLADWVAAPVEPPAWGISETGFVVIIGALLVIALAALVSTVRSSSRVD